MANTLGIIGGGQLGWLLAQAAQALELPVVLLDQDLECPAANHGFKVFSDKRDFLAACDVITFENEFVELNQWVSEVGSKKSFLPSFDALRVAQDKIQQKKLWDKLGFSHPRYLVLKKFDVQTLSSFSEECVLKHSRLGYDGKGVFFYKKGREKEAQDFFDSAHQKNVEVYVEEKISYRRELASLVVRKSDGEKKFYPLVITEQKNGICSQVRGPATQLGVDVELEVKAREILSKISDELGYVGVLAVEFFEDQSGELFINEMAPRVHNSGHYSSTSASASQFESHVRAVMDLDFKTVHVKSKFGMANLVAPSNVGGSSAGWVPKELPSTHVYWYQKKLIRPGRKMGHINFEYANTVDDSTIRLELAKCIEAWEKSDTRN